MTFSLYEASVSTFIGSLEALSGCLDKAATHAEQRKIDPAVFLTFRLFPDMFDFTRQVQLVTDFAKGAGARLAGVEIPKFDDTEKSFSELRQRISRTVTFLKTLDRKAVEAGVDRDIVLQIRGQTQTFKGRDFLMHRAIPNFYFHATTAYNILRHNGVDLGKSDFVAKL